jgi:hypothetical protein
MRPPSKVEVAVEVLRKDPPVRVMPAEDERPPVEMPPVNDDVADDPATEMMPEIVAFPVMPMPLVERSPAEENPPRKVEVAFARDESTAPAKVDVDVLVETKDVAVVVPNRALMAEAKMFPPVILSPFDEESPPVVRPLVTVDDPVPPNEKMPEGTFRFPVETRSPFVERNPEDSMPPMKVLVPVPWTLMVEVAVRPCTVVVPKRADPWTDSPFRMDPAPTAPAPAARPS